MKSIIKFFILFTTVIDINSQNLKSPSDFLGYDIGTQFSRHSQVVDYFDHVSKEMSENILLINYGKTYERRPLFYAVISSKENTSSHRFFAIRAYESAIGFLKDPLSGSIL